jgi:hypothetical protein
MSQRLQKLGPRHHAAIRMRIAGSSSRDIQEELGVQLRTLYLWFGDPLVQAEIDRQLERISDLMAEKLAVSGLRALDELMRVLGKPDREPDVSDEMKLAVARELLDRCPWMAKSDTRAPDPSCPSTRCALRRDGGDSARFSLTHTRRTEAFATRSRHGPGVEAGIPLTHPFVYPGGRFRRGGGVIPCPPPSRTRESHSSVT